MLIVTSGSWTEQMRSGGDINAPPAKGKGESMTRWERYE